MKPFSIIRGPADLRDSFAGTRPASPFKEATPVEMRPTITLSFTVGSTMKEIHDAVIRTILQHTHSIAFGQRRCCRSTPGPFVAVWVKEAAGSSTRAA